MRVFVYSKKTSKKVAQINHVAIVNDSEEGVITFITESNEKFSFSKKEVKTTTYQN